MEHTCFTHIKHITCFEGIQLSVGVTHPCVGATPPGIGATPSWCGSYTILVKELDITWCRSYTLEVANLKIYIL